MKLAVIGTGAIGGWLTSGFIEAGANASVLARGATLEVLRASGLGLNDGTSTWRYPVVTTDDPADLRNAGVLLSGLKAHDLPKLAPLIAAVPGPQTSVVAANHVLLGDAGSGGKADEIARHLACGGVPAAAADDINREVWSKLLGNSNMNPLSALSRADLSSMLGDDGVRGLAISMMREMLAVGARIGRTGFSNVEEWIDATRKLGAF